MPRLRQKTSQANYSAYGPFGNLIESSDINVVHEYFYESRYPGSNACDHISSTISSGENTTTYNTRNVYRNFSSNLISPTYPNWDIIWNQVNTNELDWDNLSSSSGFNLLMIIAELDDTIALFTLKFWKSLSYGSITWGVLPFISDIKAILQMIKRLDEKISALSYETKITRGFDSRYVSGYGMVVYASGSVDIRYSGTCSIPEQFQAAVWLDRLAIHPDIGTLWDLIPFSFVIDYLLPIGSFIDSFKGGGWVKQCSFTGWVSYDFNVTTELCAELLPDFTSKSTSLTNQVTRYVRSYANNLVLSNMPEYDPPDLKLPSLSQLFNMFYLVYQGLSHH